VNGPARGDRAIAWWLLACCALVFAMVVLGGVTRLTHSGLSIVEWDPILGAIPPLSDADWASTFAQYQQFPEYREVNRGMSLAEFKNIFWFEYAHRLLGRSIGVVFLLPFLWFAVRGRIRGGLLPKLLGMFVLGGLQGLMGWYMVKSGLVDVPRVSAYRLTAHLLLAVLIYSYMLWVALGLLLPRLHAAPDPGVRRFALLVTALVVVVVALGGFVAGTRAGFVFNTFPLMNGQWLPAGYLAMQPWYVNLFENVATVQFNHRWAAIFTALAVLALWWRGRRIAVPRARAALNLLLVVAAAQVALGIATLLHVVPVALAAAHQGGAMLLLTAALLLNHALRRPAH